MPGIDPQSRLRRTSDDRRRSQQGDAVRLPCVGGDHLQHASPGHRRRRPAGQARGRQRPDRSRRHAAARSARDGRELEAQGSVRRGRRDDSRCRERPTVPRTRRSAPTRLKWSILSGTITFPTPSVLKLVGDCVQERAREQSRRRATGIRAHFDVGPELPRRRQPTYVEHRRRRVPRPRRLGARRRVHHRECRACRRAALTCQFPGFPGTVSWKIGFQVYRDAPVAADGAELSGAAEDACEASEAARHRRRAGTASTRSARTSSTTCSTRTRAASEKSTDPNSPDFHVPRGSSGIADLPGGDALVSLGLLGATSSAPTSCRRPRRCTSSATTSGVRHGGNLDRRRTASPTT